MRKYLKIEKIKALEVLDSRGNPTVQVEAFSGNFSGKALVPSGASTGSFEAIELRDNEENRYMGLYSSLFFDFFVSGINGREFFFGSPTNIFAHVSHFIGMIF